MFSGKSEELIRRLRRAQIARQKVQIFKPAIDTRYADDHIVSHSEMRIQSRAVEGRARAARRSPPTPKSSASTRAVLRPGAAGGLHTLADRGKRVIVAGLDQDYLGKPFEPMPQLLAIAEYITKTHAICMVCGNPANHTQRLVASERSRAARRAGHLRGALPPLLRSAPGAASAHRGRRRSATSTLRDPNPAGTLRITRAPMRARPDSLVRLVARRLFLLRPRLPRRQRPGRARARALSPRQAVGAAGLAGPKPRYYGSASPSASCSACSLVIECPLQPPSSALFGEAMMFVYYGYLFR